MNISVKRNADLRAIYIREINLVSWLTWRLGGKTLGRMNTFVDCELTADNDQLYAFDKDQQWIRLWTPSAVNIDKVRVAVPEAGPMNIHRADQLTEIHALYTPMNSNASSGRDSCAWTVIYFNYLILSINVNFMFVWQLILWTYSVMGEFNSTQNVYSEAF